MSVGNAPCARAVLDLMLKFSPQAFTVLANEASEFQHSSFHLSLVQSAAGGLQFSEDKAVDFFQRM